MEEFKYGDYTKEQADNLIAYLAKQDKWTTQTTLTAKLGIPGVTIRAIAHEHPEIITGNQGYWHYDKVTDEDVERCVNSLVRRSDAIKQRAKAMAFYHRSHRGAIVKLKGWGS